MTQRPDHHEYFMCLALMAAQRASCPRRKVGCVLVDANKYVVSTGYNGPAAGLPNCTDKPCGGQSHKSGQGLSSCIAVHAEINAYNQAGDRLKSVTAMYLTAGPCCEFCTATTVELIESGQLSGLQAIYYFDTYPSGTEETFKNYGIELIPLGRGLTAESLLLKTAIMLGLRKEYIPPSVICIGGPAHGHLYNYSDVQTDYMRVYVSDMKPDEHKLIDYSVFNDQLLSKGGRVDVGEYYKVEYQTNHARFRIFRFANLSPQEFDRLFAEVRMSPQFNYVGY